MKNNVARNCIIALHRMYIPNSANRLKDTLILTMPTLFNESVKNSEITSDTKDANSESRIINTTLTDAKIIKE
jgi:hypothetical protein